jgi:hypothetical protein
MAPRALDTGCTLIPWLLSLGFVTSFSALFFEDVAH